MRKLALLLIAGLVASMLSACGGGGNAGADGSANGAAAGNTTTVQFWGHVNEAWNQSHQDTIDRFNASQPDIRVEATFFPFNDFEAKIQTSLLSGGEGADLYEIWGGWALDFIQADALSPVPQQFMADLVQDCYEPVIGAFKGSDGSSYYGVPLEYNVEYGAMLVNKPRFEGLGLAYPTTWDEMMDIARRTAKQDGETMEMRGIDFITNDVMTATFLSMILSQGGEYLVDGKIVLNTPEAVTAMKTLVGYVTVDKVTNLDSATGAAGVNIDGHHFLSRDEAMIVPRGPWVIADMEATYGLEYGVDFDYIPEPFFGSVKAFPAETGWGMCVPKAAKNAEAAWIYAEYFLEEDNLMQHNIRSGMIPPRKSIINDPAFVEALPYAAPLVENLQYGKFIGPFNTDVLKDDLKFCFISLCQNDGTYASVEDALIALEAQLNADLKLG